MNDEKLRDKILEAICHAFDITVTEGNTMLSEIVAQARQEVIEKLFNEIKPHYTELVSGNDYENGQDYIIEIVEDFLDKQKEKDELR